MPAPQTEVLITVDGKEHARHVLPPGEYIIGRNSDCPIRVDADLVSRQHAKLILNYDHALIEDIGSANGTQVNGQPVTARTRLWPNQKIQVGTAAIELRRLQTEAPSDMSLAPAQRAVRDMLPSELLREKKYDIGAVVARGGMGAILDAREAAIERRVAMKVMLDTNDAGDIARFIAEAKVTGQLEHPNIVPIHELGVDENGQPFYTMQMVRGITLKKVLELLAKGVAETVQKFPLSALLTVFQKVCDASAFAHSKGVIHRDLKPENIMLGDFGSVLVMDWGLAKVLRNAGNPTQEPSPRGQDFPRSVASACDADPTLGSTLGSTLVGTIMGTPQYMAPEQARGEIDTLDQRADIYALGAILYHILALRPSVTGKDAMEVVGKVGRGGVEPLENVTPRRKDAKNAQASDPKSSPFAPSRLCTTHLPGGRIPDSLAAVVRKAMALDREARYRSVPELQQDIEAFQTGFATSAENAGAWKQFTLFIRRNKAASIGVAAVLIIGGAFGTKALIEGRRAERALATLGKAAPSLAAQARSLVMERKLDEAIEKLDFALTIAPQNPDFHLQRAHLMQASLNLAAAAEGYRRVLVLRKGDASANANLALCEQILTRSKGAELLSADLQSLLRAMLDQNREAEAAPLALQLGKGDAAVAAAIDDALRAWKQLPGWGTIPGRVARLGDGSWRISLEKLAVSDLGPLAKLRGLPISELNLSFNPIEDLSPLSDLPLRKIVASHVKVRSLVPLRGMPLRILNLNRSGMVTSLDGLQGVPLEWLDIYDNPVSDLTPLRGAPLRDLELGFRNNISTLAGLEGAPLERIGSSFVGVLEDVSALRSAPLREAQFPSPRIKDFSVLATCPKLEMISFNPAAPGAAGLRTMTHLKVQVSGGRILPMAEYWKEYDAKAK